MNRRHPLALTAALLVVLAGCTDDPQLPVDGTPTTSASSSGAPSAPSASASSTLAADQQQAFEDATDAVMAYAQTWVDLYTGARTNLNDLDLVLAEGDLLDASLKKVQQDLVAGVTATPKGAQVHLVSSVPVSIKLSKKPPTVVLKACIDGTDVTTHLSEDSAPEPGVRQQATYTVVQTTYLPAPGWAVQDMEGPADPEQQRC